MAKAVKVNSQRASSKNSDSSKSNGMKYKDKSGGQPEMVKIFEEIKKLLLPYEKGHIKVLGGSGGRITLISKKASVIGGREVMELWFAAAMVQKGYVGFYYMPIYGQPEMKKAIKPELLKCLKGKTCFHIRKFDKQIFDQINEALELGYQRYQANGWV